MNAAVNGIKAWHLRDSILQAWFAERRGRLGHSLD